MKTKTALLIGAVALVAGGCVQSHREPVVYYTPAPAYTTAPAYVPAPASDRPVDRVYTRVPAGQPPSVADGDVALADQISQLLKGDSHMADASQSVLVKVRNGRVDLRGSVPSEQDRSEIVEKVSQLPGVRGINNELGVER